MIIITHVHSHLGDTPLDDCNQLTVPTSAYTHMFTPFSAQDVISDVRYCPTKYPEKAVNCSGGSYLNTASENGYANPTAHRITC